MNLIAVPETVTNFSLAQKTEAIMLRFFIFHPFKIA